MSAVVDLQAAASPAGIITAQPAHSRPQIPALTGLRFVAAFSILYGHALGWDAQFQNTDVDSYLGFIGIPGMSLFFVLSGFVIHYNYRDLFLRRGFARAICEFAAARLARLYPLYLAFLLIAIAADSLIAAGPQALPILGYFITSTQSWWYTVYSGKLIINWLFPLSWSISTEMFFYAAYPAVVFLISSVDSGRRMVWIGAVYALAVIGALIASLTYLAPFLHLAQRWIPDYIAPDGGAFDDSFYHWFFYFSPYMRVLEFLLGCMTAQAMLQLRSHAVSAREDRLAAWALGVALFFLLLISLITVNTIRVPVVDGYVQHLQSSFLCGPPVAVILFCSARYKSWFSRFVSLPWLVLLGEMSYSIYLVHTWTLRLFVHDPRVMTRLQILDATLCVVCGIALTILVSYGTYHIIEMPARRWLRRSLGAASSGAFAGAGKSAVNDFAPIRSRRVKRAVFGASVALALAVVAVTGQAAQSERVAAYVHRLLYHNRSEVVVVSSSYGVNCRAFAVAPPPINSAAPGNVTDKIKQYCRFSAKCDIVVDVNWLGDPAGGCGKDFNVEYRCTGRPEVKTGYLPAEAHGKHIVLECPASVDAAAPSAVPTAAPDGEPKR
jgi:peptidoglycan/LPS O-acetylase OafA/YrhL